MPKKIAWLLIISATQCHMGLAWAAPAKQFFCWKNAAEVQECGNAVPPEFSKKGYLIKDQNGVVIKEVGAEISEEQRRILEEEKKKLADAKLRAEMRARDDKQMLDKFPTEEDIKLQLDDKVKSVEAAISVNNSQIQFYQKSLQETEKVIKASKNAEERKKMQEQIPILQQQIAKFEELKTKNIQELESIKTEYEQLLVRYKEIKSAKEEGTDTSKDNQNLASIRGFRGFTLGAQRDTMPLLQLSKTQGELHHYRNPGETLVLDQDIPLTHIDYVFYQETLVAIQIRWQTVDHTENVRLFLERNFGPASNASDENRIRWRGKHILIIYRPNWRIFELIVPEQESLLQKTTF